MSVSLPFCYIKISWKRQDRIRRKEKTKRKVKIRRKKSGLVEVSRDFLVTIYIYTGGVANDHDVRKCFA